MVRTQNIGIDGSGSNTVFDPVGYKKIIDPPSGVIFPGIEPVAPPAVHTDGIGIAEPEGVCKTGIQKISEAFPFFVRESGIAPVGGGILQVDFLMGHIQISAGNDRFALVQFLQTQAEGFVPFQPMVDSCQFFLGIG